MFGLAHHCDGPEQREGNFILEASNHPEQVSKANASGKKMWYVYILECQDKALCTGVTNNMKRRFINLRTQISAKLPDIVNNLTTAYPQANSATMGVWSLGLSANRGALSI